MEHEVSLFGWWLGLGIAFGLIVVVVVVVSAILTLARRIGLQARTILADLDAARINTLGLWEVEQTNRAAKGILDAARAARGALGG
jgi:hypothetical protein